MKKKKCTKCGLEKPLDHFNKASRNPDGLLRWCRECHKKYRVENHDKYVAYSHKSYLKRYEMTPKEYDEILQKQNYVCAICGQKEVQGTPSGRIKKLAVDHCHQSRDIKIRGLLCHRCNVVLGEVYDNPDLLQKMIDYLSAG